MEVTDALFQVLAIIPPGSVGGMMAVAQVRSASHCDRVRREGLNTASRMRAPFQGVCCVCA